MSVRDEHSETVGTSPDRAFAAIHDLPRTAKWMPPCVSWEKVGSGPNAPGDKLKYVYRQGGRTGEMAGDIVARTPGERLHCKYFDVMLIMITRQSGAHVRADSCSGCPSP